ncbi:hypothetical protein GCM10027060_17810 [Nesterenkonia halophila]
MVAFQRPMGRRCRRAVVADLSVMTDSPEVCSPGVSDARGESFQYSLHHTIPMVWITLQALQALHAPCRAGDAAEEGFLHTRTSRHAERDSPQGSEDLARITGAALM